MRWTSGRARFRFVDLPAGRLAIEVRIRAHQGPVTVSAAGVVLGVLGPGERAGDYQLRLTRRGPLMVELAAETFAAGDGRHLGALLERVSVRAPRSAWPSGRVMLDFAAPAVAISTAALLTGLGGGVALFAAFGLAAVQALALWPHGGLHSDYRTTLAVLLVVGAILAGAFGSVMRRRRAGSAGWAFASALVVLAVQGVAATSPLMVVSDAVFHANKLAAVAGGDLFPTSVTQHAEPFRFPYGVAFYALLAPLARTGVDLIALVRGGAALAGLLASAGLFWVLLARGPRVAGLAVLLLQILPITFDVFSFGNLSNIFAQAAMTLFFAWWASSAPGGWPVGAMLLALGALGHFSGLVVLCALVAALVVARRGAGGLDPVRRTAAVAGLGLALLYYASFTGLILEQLPRLGEGGGQGGGAGLWSVLGGQALAALRWWGAPAMMLAVAGWPRSRWGRLERDLLGFWIAGGLLGVAAVVSPLEVRHFYALSVPLAASAAFGLERLSAAGGPRRAAAWILLLLQAAIGLRGIVEAVLQRYRP